MFAEIGRNLLNFVQAVIALNNQFITTLLRVCCEAWRGTGIFISGLVHGATQIGTYMLDLGQEILQIVYYFLAACYSLGVILLQILSILLAGLENIGAIIAGILVKVLRYGYEKFSAAMVYLASASAETRIIVRRNMSSGVTVCKDCLDAVYVWVCDTTTIGLKQVAACLFYVRDLSKEGYEILKEKSTRAYEQMLSAMFRVCEYIRSNISEEYLMWCACTLCLVSIVLFMKRYLSRHGLTFPPFVTAYHNTSVLHLRDERDFEVFNLSDEEPEEEEEEEEDIEDGSDGTEDTGDSSVEEYEIATSDEEEGSEDEENDENLINVQLPELTDTNCALRARATPFTDRSNTKMSQESLEKILERERDRRACVVCQDALKCVLVLPCRHMCLCIHCAHHLVSQRIRQRICPLCRTRIETIMNVYV